MTSTARVSSASAMPNGLPSSAAPFGVEVAPRAIGAPASRAIAIMRTMWSRFMVASNTFGVPGQFGGTMTDRVDLDVIGVAVVAVPVVDREHVGVLLAQDVGQPFGGLVERRLQERLGIVVLLPPGHAAVLVAEPHDAVDAERCGRAVDLGRGADRRATRRRRDPRAPRRSRRWWRSPARRDGPRRWPGPGSRRC